MLDSLFAIILLLACFKGWRKGLIVALFSIIACIIGIAAALKLSAIVANYLKPNITVSDKWIPFISFALVFIVVLFLVNRLGKMVESAFEMVLLGWVNRLGGVLLYAALYIVIFSVFLFFAEQIHLLSNATLQAAATYPFVQPWGPFVMDNFGKAIPIFKEMFTQLESFFEALSDNLQH
ncbi:MAG TPA: CvpA family protein [Ferruginibacter sp.]|nr:CvpA family protein [Ferruginibacter sp.]HMP19801.1 CvpA family protein [Ferruginibacter sp.]